MEKVKILLVEDDPQLGFVVKEGLEQNGYQVDLFENGKLALDHFIQFPSMICLVDVMMPVMDGFTLVKRLRELDPHVPVLLLTAKGLKEDKIEGFKSGADDYLVKPFSMEELLMRINVFLNRNRKNNLGDVQQNQSVGKYSFNHNNMELSKDGKIIRLTRKEGELMHMLLTQQGKLIKRETLLIKIWGNDDYFAGRSMDVYISKLRKYLKEDPSLEIINYHGTGFMLQENK
jgi:DNA-binding response OmpR family regulator